jgi:hypothetical protein
MAESSVTAGHSASSTGRRLSRAGSNLAVIVSADPSRPTEIATAARRSLPRVEETFALLHQFRRLAVRLERHLDLHDGLVSLACALI